MDLEEAARRDALEKARRIHAENVVVDTEAPIFTSQLMVTPNMVETARAMLARGESRSAVRTAMGDSLIHDLETDDQAREDYLAYWRRSGVTAASCSIYDSGPPWSAWDEALTDLAAGNRLIQAMNGTMITACCAADIERAQREGRFAIIQNLQNTDPLDDRLERVDLLHSLGVRIVQFTYNLRNRFGDGCLEKRDGGLSRLGETLVAKLNSRRILIDLSHGSDLSVLDAVAASRAPVACTHTSVRVISGHRRAKPDEVLRAVADRGGIIGVLLVPFFILPPDGDGRAEAAGLPAGCATMETMMDHIVYLLNLVGSDCVAIGTDWSKPYQDALNWSGATPAKSGGFDWVGWRPEDRFSRSVYTQGLESWDLWPNLTAAMLVRGIPEETVVKIVGGNFLRVFREVCG